MLISTRRIRELFMLVFLCNNFPMFNLEIRENTFCNSIGMTPHYIYRNLVWITEVKIHLSSSKRD